MRLLHFLVNDCLEDENILKTISIREERIATLGESQFLFLLHYCCDYLLLHCWSVLRLLMVHKQEVLISQLSHLINSCDFVSVLDIFGLFVFPNLPSCLCMEHPLCVCLCTSTKPHGALSLSRSVTGHFTDVMARMMANGPLLVSLWRWLGEFVQRRK